MARHEKKYIVEYASGACGYGWTHECDRLEEFEDFVNEMRNHYTAYLSVWDTTLDGFIFYKRTLEYRPDIDILDRSGRDMRTTTRTRRPTNDN